MIETNGDSMKKHTEASNKLIIFFDGNCPMCSLEMLKLKQYDTENRIELCNLHQKGFTTLYPDIDFDKAMAILHGYYQGEVLLGLNVTHRAWTIVGKGLFVAPLQFPVIKQVAHLIYLLIAKYRHPISHFMYKRLGIGQTICTKGTCYEKDSLVNHRRK